jgi:RNA recognition motif-containing protein
MQASFAMMAMCCLSGQVQSLRGNRGMFAGKRCYVGNLAWKTSWQDLKDLFRSVGTVVYSNVMVRPPVPSTPQLPAGCS